MKKFPNRFVIAGMIIFAVSMIVNTIASVAYILSSIPDFEDVTRPINVAQLVTTVISNLYCMAVVLVPTIITLIKYYSNNSVKIWSTVLCTVAALNLGSALIQVINLFVNYLIYSKNDLQSLSIGNIFFYLFRWEPISMIGLIFLTLGGLGLMLKTKQESTSLPVS